MGLWEEIERQPHEEHNALIRLNCRELLEECLEEHNAKLQLGKKSGHTHLEHINGIIIITT